MSLDETCVHYKAHKNNPEEVKYKLWGCHECNGYKKECDQYVGLSEVMFPEEQMEENK